MKITEISKKIIHNIPSGELLSLHYRIHQLYQLSKKRGKEDKKLKNIHDIISHEIDRRGLVHKSNILRLF